MSDDVHIDHFELRNVRDLFRKIESDLKQLESSGQNAFVAFNLFVALEHLPDWLGKSDKEKKSLRAANWELRVVSHIANGLKHFAVGSRRHSSVEESFKERVYEEACYEEGVFEEPLVIVLTDSEALAAGVECVDALTLGKRTMDFWRPYVVGII